MDILTLCSHVTSVGIYYHGSDPGSALDWEHPDIGGRLFDILTRKDRMPLKSLGIYCIPLLQNSYYADPVPNPRIMPFLDRIISCPDALESLEHFDIVERLLPPSPFPPLPLLTSLTLFRSWSHYRRDTWTFKQLCDWIAGSKLTRIQLINCTFHAGDIPECVRICQSLQHLMVSGCGDYDDVPSLPRPPGWSKHPDALCVRRRPLETLFIEHVEHWETIALGVIPALHVTITSALFTVTGEIFDQDEEIFPHLQKLSMERPDASSDDDELNMSMEALNRLSRGRGFIVEYDACWCVNHLG
ncbi:hypothetical protein CPB86DRAFT_821109 [Serendipita vermifera]|nr:hypothetical protein CPB86DRAFT_821109 [Serendipita vermifera]